jgi:hypothetical protein
MSRRQGRHVVGLLALLLAATAVAALPPAPEGRVRFYNIADSDFDRYSRAPTRAEQAWMRAHYSRMQVYSPWFDERLAWYPDAWVYLDSLAIKPHWPVFREHPEWVLRDRHGRMLFIDWGCSGGTCPQYAADVGNPAFRAWWIARARTLAGRGYRGIWVDDVNLDWRTSDGDGERVLPHDPRTGRTMTLPDWRGYFADFMEELRRALPDVELAHNSIWYAGPPDDPAIRRQIAAADWINLERGATDRGLRGGGGRFGFDTFLAFIDAVHEQGRAVVLMDYGTTVREREYGLAAWLLVSAGRDLLSSDQLAWTAPGSLWPGYALDLGAAAGPRLRWQGLWRREFRCGLVLLNPPEAPRRRTALGAAYRTLEGARVSGVTLPAASAAVLAADCARPAQKIEGRTSSERTTSQRIHHDQTVRSMNAATATPVAP